MDPTWFRLWTTQLLKATPVPFLPLIPQNLFCCCLLKFTWVSLTCNSKHSDYNPLDFFSLFLHFFPLDLSVCCLLHLHPIFYQILFSLLFLIFYHLMCHYIPYPLVLFPLLCYHFFFFGCIHSLARSNKNRFLSEISSTTYGQVKQL